MAPQTSKCSISKYMQQGVKDPCPGLISKQAQSCRARARVQCGNAGGASKWPACAQGVAGVSGGGQLTAACGVPPRTRTVMTTVTCCQPGTWGQGRPFAGGETGSVASQRDGGRRLRQPRWESGPAASAKQQQESDRYRRWEAELLWAVPESKPRRRKNWGSRFPRARSTPGNGVRFPRARSTLGDRRRRRRAREGRLRCQHRHQCQSG